MKTKMGLIEQFPDISEKIRAKIKPGQRSYKAVTVNMPSYVEDKAVIKYFEGELRSWQVKLLFILAGCISILYFAHLQSTRILNWITVL